MRPSIDSESNRRPRCGIAGQPRGIRSIRTSLRSTADGPELVRKLSQFAIGLRLVRADRHNLVLSIYVRVMDDETRNLGGSEKAFTRPVGPSVQQPDSHEAAAPEPCPAQQQASSTVSTDNRESPVVRETLPIVEQSVTAWVPQTRLSVDQWVELGRRLGRLGSGSNWWIGDWARYGNMRYGERYKVASKVTGYDRQTLMNFASVAAHIPPSERRPGVSWSHHAELASLTPSQRALWLDRTVRDRLSLKDLRIELRAARAAKTSAEPAAASGTSNPVCPTCGRPLGRTGPVRGSDRPRRRPDSR